uniref:AraC family transcriptional regulator n=1 Tax=Angiostrongylus cantonensis TaxID=6313 RepID=A0A0K0CWZ1_ANGCA
MKLDRRFRSFILRDVTIMDEELAPILNEDCMLFSPAAFSLDDDFQLTNLQYTTVGKMVKTEIQEDTRG